MNVLIGMEESGIIREAFRKRGHNAWSCDLQPTRKPGPHLQCDIFYALDVMKWHIIILHPECTKMAVSGNRDYSRGKPGWKGRVQAVEWTFGLWSHALTLCDRVCLEQPVGVLASHKGMPKAQYIQPWQYGHGEQKRTALFLHGLPELEPTNIVAGREQRIWKMPPSETRQRDRSETYSGVAGAMAKQWGILPITTNNSANNGTERR